jgi:hypothetical protein
MKGTSRISLAKKPTTNKGNWWISLSAV